MKKRFNRRRFIELSAGTVAIAAGFGGIADVNGISAFALAAVSTSITLNGSGTGRVFNGIGAISGGGGNSRLLIDYPEPYRTQILDYLFKPNYGANLHILKVEVGGDTNSTDGAEASFMHTATDQNFTRGYEWWLMQQARMRNPNIKLYALAWGAPGWIGTTGATVFDTSHPFWSQDMVNYYIAWIKGAKSNYNLTIDYVGGWNERSYNKAFYEALHSAIQSNGLSTLVVGDDDFGWSTADAMVSDATFNASIDIVGSHYPCGYLSAESSCSSTSNAISLGKPLWASESGSQDYNSGALPMARGNNRSYIDAKMTAVINWPLIASLNPNLPFNTDGLMLADQGWSGTYSIGKQLWVTAHTTQFTQPGWHYIDGACGYLGGSSSNGSYVTLKSTNGSDYSVVIETVDATASQTVTFLVENGLSTGTVHVWSTNLNSASSSDFFLHASDLTPSSSSYTVTLQPGFIYSLTTTSGQGKGTIAGPPPAALGLPYADNFDSYTLSQEARYFSDINGAFEIVAAGGGRSGEVLRQMAPTAPIPWAGLSDPYTLMGDTSWTDYTVTCDVLLEQAGYVQLLGRVGALSRDPSATNGYYLRVTNGGAWSILKNTTTSGSISTLLSGSTTALGLNTWHTLALSFQGSTLTARINGTTVGTVTDSSYSTGQVGLGVSGWQNAQFDNFSVTTTLTTIPGTYYKLVNRNSGLVLDVSGASTSNGGLLIQSTDSAAASQHWQLVGVGNGYLNLVNVNSGLVLDVPGSSTTGGVQLIQWAKNGGKNQQWQFLSTGTGYYTLVNLNSGMLADVANASTASGAQVIQWPSTGGVNQQWQLVEVPTAGATYELVNHNSGQLIDVSGASTSNGGVIIQWPSNGGANQHWRLISAGSGYFNLVNVNSGLLLGVPSSSTTAGVQLIQWSNTGVTDQQWQFVSVSGGYYTLVNRNSGLLADVAGASTVAGAAVIQASSNSGLDQQWRLSSPYWG
jgi:hypothetical protein